MDVIYWGKFLSYDSGQMKGLNFKAFWRTHLELTDYPHHTQNLIHGNVDYCQARSQSQHSWTELALISLLGQAEIVPRCGSRWLLQLSKAQRPYYKVS